MPPPTMTTTMTTVLLPSILSLLLFGSASSSSSSPSYYVDPSTYVTPPVALICNNATAARCVCDAAVQDAHARQSGADNDQPDQDASWQPPPCDRLIQALELPVVEMTVRKVDFRQRLHDEAVSYEDYFKEQLARLISGYCERQAHECPGAHLRLNQYTADGVGWLAPGLDGNLTQANVALLRVERDHEHPQQLRISFVVTKQPGPPATLVPSDTVDAVKIKYVVASQTEQLGRKLGGAHVGAVRVHNMRRPLTFEETDNTRLLYIVIPAGLFVLLCWLIGALFLWRECRKRKRAAGNIAPAPPKKDFDVEQSLVAAADVDQNHRDNQNSPAAPKSAVVVNNNAAAAVLSYNNNNSHHQNNNHGETTEIATKSTNYGTCSHPGLNRNGSTKVVQVQQHSAEPSAAVVRWRPVERDVVGDFDDKSGKSNMQTLTADQVARLFACDPSQLPAEPGFLDSPAASRYDFAPLAPITSSARRSSSNASRRTRSSSRHAASQTVAEYEPIAEKPAPPPPPPQQPVDELPGIRIASTSTTSSLIIDLKPPPKGGKTQPAERNSALPDVTELTSPPKQMTGDEFSRALDARLRETVGPTTARRSQTIAQMNSQNGALGSIDKPTTQNQHSHAKQPDSNTNTVVWEARRRSSAAQQNHNNSNRHKAAPARDEEEEEEEEEEEDFDRQSAAYERLHEEEDEDPHHRHHRRGGNKFSDDEDDDGRSPDANSPDSQDARWWRNKPSSIKGQSTDDDLK